MSHPDELELCHIVAAALVAKGTELRLEPEGLARVEAGVRSASAEGRWSAALEGIGIAVALLGRQGGADQPIQALNDLVRNLSASRRSVRLGARALEALGSSEVRAAPRLGTATPQGTVKPGRLSKAWCRA